MGILDWKYASREGPDSDAWINDTTAAQFTVPDREVWHVLSLRAEITTTATAGTRQVRLEIRDDTDDIMLEIAAGATQIASLTRVYNFSIGAPDLSAFRDSDVLMTPIPSGLILRPGWDISAFTSAGDSVDDSDATSDLDLVVTQLEYAYQKILSTDGSTPQTSD